MHHVHVFGPVKEEVGVTMHLHLLRYPQGILTIVNAAKSSPYLGGTDPPRSNSASVITEVEDRGEREENALERR